MDEVTFVILYISDHYVIIGASRTNFDRSDSGSIAGTALLLALAEQLNFLKDREGWRPNRTIKLISWGAAEFGNIGMIEYLEVNVHFDTKTLTGLLKFTIIYQRYSLQ